MAIVLLLVLVWAVALAPLVWRKLVDIQVISEVARFNHRIGILRRSVPAVAGRSGARSAPAGGSTYALRAPVAHRTVDGPLSEDQRRLLRARADRRIARRRRAIGWLGGTVLVTLLFGAVPALRFMWDLSITATVLTVVYLGLIAWCQHEASSAAERSRKVVQLHPGDERRSAAAVPERAVAAGASAGGPAVSLPRRPAFVLVDAPS